eukprot:TRINITY_DN1641_c0_g1_i1.p1 TRINITY_DN1641_c0_g1~~TRINITY_DN1641_c0_g1_i1.p1  ORF type:complete len:549 (+),score=97.69 TRINITY_DN1641_c0_g1_i1:126-1772(+)
MIRTLELLSVLSFLLTLILSSDEISCALSVECIDGLSEEMCVVIGGKTHYMNCSQYNGNVGSCCKYGYCSKATQALCEEIGFGTWYDNGGSETECACPPVQSCCVGAGCIDDLSEDTCINDYQGQYHEYSCGAGKCYLNLPMGACCNVEGCQQINQLMCGPYNWYENMTCGEAKCGTERPDYSLNVSSSSSGRCCGPHSCSEGEEADCTETYYYYGADLGCLATNHPCFNLGSCISGDSCIEYISEDMCYAYGGTFFSGGTCLTLSPRGYCYVAGNCNYANEYNCMIVNGNFSLDEPCPEVQGACCNGNSTCTDITGIDCSIYTNDFFPGEICSDFPCSLGTCCYFKFCIPDVELSFCGPFMHENSEEEVYYTRGDTCPATGSCDGKDIGFKDETIELILSISINEIQLKIETSNYSMIDFQVNNGNFSVSSSTVTADNLILLRSNLYLSLDSNLTIADTLTIQNGAKLYISLTEEERARLSDGERITLISYTNLVGEFDEVETDDECTQVAVTSVGILVNFNPDCQVSSSPTFVILLLQVLLVVALL